MTHVVSPSGYPLQPQQQCYSTDSCSSVDSFRTTIVDPPMYHNTMKQIVPGVSMQYTNVQVQNPITQTNSIHGLTDSCSNVDSFSTTKKDLSVNCNTMKQIVPRGMAQYTNVQLQNPIVQTNSIHDSTDCCSSVDSFSTTRNTNVQAQNPKIQPNIHSGTVFSE